MMKLIRVVSRLKQNFIEEHGIEPIYEEFNIAWYERTDKLLLLLDKCMIREIFYQKRI